MEVVRDIEHEVTFNLVNGKSFKLKTLVSANENRNLGSEIESAMRSGWLSIEVDGVLKVVPLHNIQSLEISPSPNVVMAHCISNAHYSDGER